MEKEHAQHLRDAQRIEDRSALATNASVASLGMDGSPSDFAKLVGGGGAQSPATNGVSITSSEDDLWGSILNGGVSFLRDASSKPVLTAISVTADAVNDASHSSAIDFCFAYSANSIVAGLATARRHVPSWQIDRRANAGRSLRRFAISTQRIKDGVSILHYVLPLPTTTRAIQLNFITAPNYVQPDIL